jgi:hypothetical protein
MQRRVFLGSILGTYAASLVPYVATANPLPIEQLPYKLRMLNIGTKIFITDDLKTLHRYKFNLLALVNNQVVEIAGPRVCEVVCDKVEGKAVFTAEAVHMKKEIILGGLALISSENIKLIEADYSSPISFRDGDTLHNTYTFSI